MDEEPNSPRGEGTPIFRIVNPETQETIGWQYHWENGVTTNLWLTEKQTILEYVPIPSGPSEHIDED